MFAWVAPFRAMIRYRFSEKDHAPSKIFGGRGRGTADERLSDRLREHVVEIEMELAEHADTAAARAVDRNDRLDTDLEIASDPDNARIDRAGGDVAVAEIVGGRRRKLRLDYRNEMID